jgi:hypothetical protein
MLYYVTCLMMTWVGMRLRCLSFLQIYNIRDICIGSFFLQKIDPKNVHNTLCLMLDPWYKNLHLIFSFIGKEDGIHVINGYDYKILCLKLLKCYEQLHCVLDVPCDTQVVQQKNKCQQIFKHFWDGIMCQWTCKGMCELKVIFI